MMVLDISQHPLNFAKHISKHYLSQISTEKVADLH